MGQFRKKPVVIEAHLFDHDRPSVDAPDWLVEGLRCDVITLTKDDGWYVQTLESGVLAPVHKIGVGDWLIRGVQGELYPCKPDIFEATYEPA